MSSACSSSSLSPPATLRPRGSSITSSLSLNSLNPRSRPVACPPEPQTPSPLVRKDTAPTTMIQHPTFNITTPSGETEQLYDEHPGSPHRPMLSVLLSLSVAVLPPFARSNSYRRLGTSSPAAQGTRHQHHRKSSRRISSRVWDASQEEESGPPPSPFTSLFIAPPNPISLLPSPSDPATIRRHRSNFAPILILLILFVLSLFPIIIALSSLPITAFRSLPKTVKDVAQLGHELSAYADSSSRGKAHVIAVLSITAIWKHAWSIPGSVVLNIIAGTIFASTAVATLHMTLLTTIGSILASLLSTPLAPLVEGLFPKALAITRSALEGTSSSNSAGPLQLNEKDNGMEAKTPTWVRLVVMRLVGVVPWSGINVACGVCSVPLWECFVGGFIGTLPWTAVTCQIGDIIQTLSSASSSSSAEPKTLSSVLTSPSIVLKLIFLSALSLGPVLGRDKLRSVLGGVTAAPPSSMMPVPVSADDEDSALHEARWKFWRRSPTASQSGSGRSSFDEVDSEEGEVMNEKL